MDVYYIITIFILGINLGSFYNVVGYRLPKGESIISPPSHCPNCNHKLTPLELIPIFSYLFQLGKCKKCQTKISLFYPLFEFTTGLLFVVAYLIFGFSIKFLITLIFISTTLIIIITDYFYYIILDEVLLISGLLILVCICFSEGIINAGMALINGVIAFGVMFLIKKLGNQIFKKESMGGGDIKLMFVIGLILGIEISIFSIFLASCIGLPISLILLFLNPKRERIIPFGPFLCMAALILFLGEIDINYIANILITV